MKTINHTLIVFVFLCTTCVHLLGQNMELRGRVVEVSNGKVKGVPNVKVKIIGESVNVTKPDGSFSLFIPAKKEYVTISLENCAHPMISPYAGRVNLPPSGELQIRVCALENTRLRNKIDKLGAQIGKLEKERKLSNRQLSQMHQVLLDTILYYEDQIQQLANNLAEKEAQLDEKQKQTNALEQEVALLQQQLFEALEEKYLRQHKTYKDLSAGLNNYRSRLKDVQREMGRVSDCFLHSEGCNNFYSAIRKYSEARNDIDESSNSNVEAVAHYWDDKNLSDQLRNTYQFILKTVHEPVMFDMVNEQVINPIKDYAARKRGRMAAQKEAERGAEAAMKELAPLITELDIKIDDILKLLNENI